MKYNILLGVILSAFVLSSCVKDLDVKPKDPNTILAGNLNDDPMYLQQVLAKLYASFIISGQGDANHGGDDISASDGNFFTTTRALWNLQELPTDEAICAWGDVGIADLNTQTWSPSNPFLTAVYQRLSLSVTYANELIRVTAGNTDPAVVRYNSEARFLRALAYFWQMDLFGNPPFVTEADNVGKFFPKQIKRADLFNYIVTELKAIEPTLGEPGTSYPQADKAAAWMLLSRVYLNAEVYTGKAKWDSCVIYSKKVIDSGKYSLATNYRQNFSANNGYDQGNHEMIFAWEQDGKYVQGYVGTTFLIESSSDAAYLPAETYHGLTSNTNWNGNRARKDFLNLMVDTIATYGNNAIPLTDAIFAASPDKRVYLKRKKSLNIPSASSSGDYGVGVYKFTATNSDGSLVENYNPAFACTDFPIFRFADAYLMYAEAVVRGAANGNRADALTYVNKVRARAYGNTTGNITDASLTLQFLFKERSKEFYYEAQRRTDLIRFGKFSTGDYNWQWKGGVVNGTSTSKHLDLYPIPGEEISSNPNIKQNDGYTN
jgi:hypothetical protein